MDEVEVKENNKKEMKESKAFFLALPIILVYVLFFVAYFMPQTKEHDPNNKIVDYYGSKT